jgi:hypothetical protein
MIEDFDTADGKGRIDRYGFGYLAVLTIARPAATAHRGDPDNYGEFRDGHQTPGWRSRHSPANRQAGWRD